MDYYEYAIPVLAKAISLDDKNRIPSSLSTYVGELKLLGDGRVQIADSLLIRRTYEAEDRENEAHPIFSQIEPTVDTAVSSLAHQTFLTLNSGFGVNTNTQSLNQKSLAKLVIDNQNAYVPIRVTEMIKATFLETYAIAKVLKEDIEVFTNHVSESDIARLVENIRWITVKLSEIENYSMDVIYEFRRLERAYKYIQQSETLYASSATKVIAQYKEALGGD